MSSLLDFIARGAPEILALGLLLQVLLVVLQSWLYRSKRDELWKIVSDSNELHAHLQGYGFTRADGTLILPSPIAQLIREWLSEEWEDSGSSRVGAAYTSVALVFTFFLIAIVLSHDVSGALATTVPTEQKDKLSTAVANMGSKFFISFAGVLAAVVVDHAIFQGILIPSAIREAMQGLQKTLLQPSKIQYWQTTLLESGGNPPGEPPQQPPQQPAGTPPLPPASPTTTQVASPLAPPTSPADAVATAARVPPAQRWQKVRTTIEEALKKEEGGRK